MLSKTAEYAVRSCLWLAQHPGQAWTVQHIAGATGIPARYLAKVLHLMARAALVRAQPGPGGGFVLARTPGQMCVLDVIEAVDALPRIRACPTGRPGHEAALCPLHARLDQVLASVEASLRQCTLAELLCDAARQVPAEGSDQ